jgi:hypothetical protein
MIKLINLLKICNAIIINFFFNKKFLIKEFKKLDKKKLTIVKFEGGLGAQIFSYSVYRYLKLIKYKTKADLSYFNLKKKIAHISLKSANVGNTGLTHWGYSLNFYGLNKNTFDVLSNTNKKEQYINNTLYFNLVFMALSHNKIKAQLPLPKREFFFKSQKYLKFNNGISLNKYNYICVHIRRGDYLNVSSYIVPDNDFLNISNKFKNIINSIVIISDSILSEKIKKKIKSMYKNYLFLDNEAGDETKEFNSHCLMRFAKILICSNSQYSLSAGMLSDGLVLFPKKWFGKELDKIEKTINSRSNFSVLD